MTDEGVTRSGPKHLSGKLQTLKKRAEFQRVRGGGRATSAAFVLEGKPRHGAEPDKNTAGRSAPDAPSGPRFGFTITKKIGNAVTRNRIRRRLRAALQHLAPGANPATDYVIVARPAAADQEFTTLLADLKRALAKVDSHRGAAKPR